MVSEVVVVVNKQVLAAYMRQALLYQQTAIIPEWTDCCCLARFVTVSLPVRSRTQIGSLYDAKEQRFRNYFQLFSTNDDSLTLFLALKGLPASQHVPSNAGYIVTLTSPTGRTCRSAFQLNLYRESYRQTLIGDGGCSNCPVFTSSLASLFPTCESLNPKATAAGGQWALSVTKAIAPSVSAVATVQFTLLPKSLTDSSGDVVVSEQMLGDFLFRHPPWNNNNLVRMYCVEGQRSVDLGRVTGCADVKWSSFAIEQNYKLGCVRRATSQLDPDGC